nr:MAG TPA: hypothetical protein [Caudoviricetes sp.]
MTRTISPRKYFHFEFSQACRLGRSLLPRRG